MTDRRRAPPVQERRIEAAGLGDDRWKDQPVIILGGGPSIKHFGFRISELQGKARIIAVNRSIELPLEPDFWCWMDRPLYTNLRDGKYGAWAQYRFHTYRGPRVTRTGSKNPAEVIELGYSPGSRLGPHFHAACIANNTGFWAVNLAYCLGCDPIVLFGFDLQPVAGKQGWWHDGYGRNAPPSTPYDRMRKHIEGIAPDLKAAGRRVWNCSPGTAIKTYEVIDDIDDLKRRLQKDHYDKARTVGAAAAAS